jgi:hypothetical protein
MSISLSGSLLLTGSIVASGNLTTTGTITAQTLVVQTITSSIVNITGSNIFGSQLSDRQTFTGSVVMTGSLTVNTTGPELQVNNNGVVIGNASTDNHSITGSLRITGSLAIGSGSFPQTFAVRISGSAFNSANVWFQDASPTDGMSFGGNGANSFKTINTYGGALHLNSVSQNGVNMFGAVGIGTTNVGSEANLHLGAFGANEGGQLILQRATSYASASHLDNYQNRFRVLSGNDTSSNAERFSVDMTNGNVTAYGSITSPSLYGNSYSQTSTSGTTSFVNTGIFYNTSLTGFGNNAIYNLVISGNPNGAGSSEYRAVYLGYIFVTTGFDFGISSVVQRINYTQVLTGDALNIGALTISAVFWNGTTETTQQTNATTNNQIRIKITGYNSSNIGAAQVVTLTKVN